MRVDRCIIYCHSLFIMIEGRSWEYRFFVDFEGNLEEPGVKNALRGLREESRSLKILGNY